MGNPLPTTTFLTLGLIPPSSAPFPDTTVEEPGWVHGLYGGSRRGTLPGPIWTPIPYHAPPVSLQRPPFWFHEYSLGPRADEGRGMPPAPTSAFAKSNPIPRPQGLRRITVLLGKDRGGLGLVPNTWGKTRSKPPFPTYLYRKPSPPQRFPRAPTLPGGKRSPLPFRPPPQGTLDPTRGGRLRGEGAMGRGKDLGA